MAVADRKLKIFISYSRKDSAFAEELLAGLELTEFDAFLDKHDIAAGEDWERRLTRLIESADTVVFVISPDSVGSPRCAWEVDKTIATGKRLLPIVWRPVEEPQVPVPLKRLNYIYFDKPHTFAVGLKALSDALRTDLDWIREHTRIGELAARWDARQRNEALLIRGDDLLAARTWVAQQPQHAPEPTLAMREFLSASEDAERQRFAREQALMTAASDAEVKRLVAEQEVQAARLVAQRRRSQLLVAGSLASVLLMAGSAFAFYQNNQNKLERERDRLRIAKLERDAAELDRIKAERQAAQAAKEVDKVTTERDSFDTRTFSSPPVITRGPVASAPSSSPSPVAVSRPAPANARQQISETAYKVMIDYDTGGREYYEKALGGAPFWPGYSSGVTIGIGYDLGYSKEEEAVAAWSKHMTPADLERLKPAIGITGPDAQKLADGLKDVKIPWSAAEAVFKDSTIPKFTAMADAALPNFRELAPDAAGALVSLVYNRGADFKSASDKRAEMRNIREHMERKEYTKIPGELRAMKRLWTSKGLQDRREAEAVLFERGLVAMGLLSKAGELPVVNAPQTAAR